jgi:hypothetical protein
MSETHNMVICLKLKMVFIANLALSMNFVPFICFSALSFCEIGFCCGVKIITHMSVFVSNFVTQLDSVHCFAVYGYTLWSFSVVDPDPYVFGLPDSDPSINNNKKVGKTLISTVTYF